MLRGGAGHRQRQPRRRLHRKAQRRRV